MPPGRFIIDLSELTIDDVAEVGGKNASLGEMIQNLSVLSIKVPGGFAVTASAYRYFLDQTGLKAFIKERLSSLKRADLADLAKRAREVREKIKQTSFPKDLEEAIVKAHRAAEAKYGRGADFAVRSSATAEDLPNASFAGEHETFLNVRGRENILEAVKAAMASLFTERAISYRVDKNFDHFKVALSVGVQKMVRSDLGSSGVMFTLDTESGFADVVLINGSWGLGEMIVQGEVTPDEFLVFKKTLGQASKPIIDKRLGLKMRKMVYSREGKPTKIVETTKRERESFILSDKEILQLAVWGVEIEKHYSQKHNRWVPMDIEWAKDGQNGQLYIIQARPETVNAQKDFTRIKTYTRLQDGKLICQGASVGSQIVSGRARVILNPKGIESFNKGEILVTAMTDPDWEPVMAIAAAIVTDKGGRTSHAAIVSRELGIPCVVGTETATQKIKNGQMLTVDTTGSTGLVLEGALKFKVREEDVKKLPRTKTHLMINIATPETAFEKSFLPNKGVGLAREEFIIASSIGIHPMALVNYRKLPEDLKSQIDRKTVGFADKTQFYIDKLAYGIARIGAAFYPNPVIVRFSDFKTNEYKTLLGGEIYEADEENPMIGFRGASRYYHPSFAPAFILEVKAVKKVREEMGLTNVLVMVPFCRTIEEGRKVVEIIERHGLSRKHQPTLKIYMMCEIPANVLLADWFLDIFDGMSIGSNDLTQLTLGIDRDGNEQVREISNENDPAVKMMVAEAIKRCKARGKYIGICGQAPSDYLDFVKFLIEQGIDSISLNPDNLISTTLSVFREEQRL